MSQTFLEASAPKSSAPAPKPQAAPVLDQSPVSIAQRKRQEAMGASEGNAALQRRVAQLQAPAEEEELLQGKFETAQLEGIEEEEPLQGVFQFERTVTNAQKRNMQEALERVFGGPAGRYVIDQDSGSTFNDNNGQDTTGHHGIKVTDTVTGIEYTCDFHQNGRYYTRS